MNKRILKKRNKDGTYSKIEVDWDKMPCSKCDWRYSMHCPKCEWNSVINLIYNLNKVNCFAKNDIKNLARQMI